MSKVSTTFETHFYHLMLKKHFFLGSKYWQNIKISKTFQINLYSFNFDYEKKLQIFLLELRFS
jgi:hypothetical protein